MLAAFCDFTILLSIFLAEAFEKAQIASEPSASVFVSLVAAEAGFKAPRGEFLPPGAKLAPRGELCSQGVKLSPRGDDSLFAHPFF
jgi:hypothetical protein